MIKHLLLDLDGTISDTREGIINCIRYSADKCGLPQLDEEILLKFIGPPLTESYMKYFDLTEERAIEAVEVYRERYNPYGILECSIYDGIPRLLKELYGRATISTASSKPQHMVEKILSANGLLEYFTLVVGNDISLPHETKAHVIERALEGLGVDENERDSVLLAGDRLYDVQGANEAKIDCVCVLYGFGSYEELRDAGGRYFVKSPDELREFIIERIAQ